MRKHSMTVLVAALAIGFSATVANAATATDILNYEQEHAESIADVNAELAHHFDPDLQRWETVRVSSFALEQFGEVKVAELMARELIAVGRDAPLIEVAQLMTKQKVHRVLVLCGDRRLLGIVSSTDFVRLIADGLGTA